VHTKSRVGANGREERTYDDATKELEASREENFMLRQHLANDQTANDQTANDQTANKEAEITSLSNQLEEAIKEAETAKERAKVAELEAQRTAVTVEAIKGKVEAEPALEEPEVSTQE